MVFRDASALSLHCGGNTVSSCGWCGQPPRWAAFHLSTQHQSLACPGCPTARPSLSDIFVDQRHATSILLAIRSVYLTLNPSRSAKVGFPCPHMIHPNLSIHPPMPPPAMIPPHHGLHVVSSKERQNPAICLYGEADLVLSTVESSSRASLSPFAPPLQSSVDHRPQVCDNKPPRLLPLWGRMLSWVL